MDGAIGKHRRIERKTGVHMVAQVPERRMGEPSEIDNNVVPNAIAEAAVGSANEEDVVMVDVDARLLRTRLLLPLCNRHDSNEGQDG